MTLSPVQIEAIVRADGRRGYAYFMEMGLGKTLTVLTEFKVMKRCGAVDRLVVICPNSFKSGWADEIEKHDLPFDYVIYESGKSYDFADLHCADVLIINYEAARTENGGAAVYGFIQGCKAYLALDESIKLKNRTAKQTVAIVGTEHKRYPKWGLASLFQVVRLLSGKPMSQGPHDLWAQLKAIDATQGISYFGWQARFCQLGGWENRQVVGTLNEDLLQKIIEPVAFQAKKQDWLKGLPTKAYTTRRYQLGPVLQKHYAEMEEDFLTYLEGEERVSVEVAIAKWEKCSQIQCGFVIDEDGKAQTLVDHPSNPRLQLLQEILDEEVSGKVVIVYRHRAAGLALAARYHGEMAWIAGGMSPAEIDEQKKLFDTRRIMLLQAEAGKYGHTLIGTPDDPCATMIFFENSYSLDTRSQLEDRIHRMGATSESCLYVDLSGSDCDARIARALQRKEQMFNKVFTDGLT
jgi:SNF2 family DNA or RNA helicase